MNWFTRVNYISQLFMIKDLLTEHSCINKVPNNGHHFSDCVYLCAQMPFTSQQMPEVINT